LAISSTIVEMMRANFSWVGSDHGDLDRLVGIDGARKIDRDDNAARWSHCQRLAPRRRGRIELGQFHPAMPDNTSTID
jgi:hypothetical protein